MTKISLADLIVQYPPVYPNNSWEETREHLVEDEHEGRIIAELVEVLKRDGSFREPILIGAAVHDEHTDVCEPNCESEDCEVEVASVVNGTHRVVAHMLHGSEWVNIITEDELTYDENEDASYIVTKIAIEPYDDDVFDELFSALRSFPIDEDLWVESSCSSGSKGVVNMLWDNKPTADNERAIHAAVVERLKQLGIATSLVETNTEKWEEES